MIRPTARLLMLFAAGLPLAVLPVVGSPRLWVAWVAFTGAAALLAGIDAILIPRARDLSSALESPSRLFIGDAGEARLTLSLRGGVRELGTEVLLDMEEDLAAQPPVLVRVPPDGAAEVAIPLVPRRRGNHRILAFWLRWPGPLGLVRGQVRLPLQRSVAVVPNLGAVRTAALRFFGSREGRTGMRVEQFLGDGSEFESLREFVPGFDPRALHWKASARHRRLLVQQFRAERDHQVVIAVDTGRLMSEPLQGIPRLDHAVTAALLLAYFGVRTGDRVGLFAFDEKVRLYAPPAGGTASFRRLQTRTAELDYSTAETNFTLGLTDLLIRLRRRSLVVVFTDFVDSVSAELMTDNLRRLARRHLVLFVALRDAALEETARAAPANLETLHRAVVAGDLVADRSRVLRKLRLAGIQCIDAPPGRVAADLVRRYLEIKRRELV